MIRTKWEPGIIYYQGQMQSCSGYAWSTLLRCHWGDDTDDPITLYKLGYHRQFAQFDGLGHRGLDISTIGEILKEERLITEIYLIQPRGSSDDRLIRFIQDDLKKGPLLLSTEWFQGFNKESGLQMEPTGPILGRHAVVVLDSCSVRGLVVQNSHGPSWGDEGRKFLKWRTLLALMRSDRAKLISIEL